MQLKLQIFETNELCYRKTHLKSFILFSCLTSRDGNISPFFHCCVAWIKFKVTRPVGDISKHIFLVIRVPYDVCIFHSQISFTVDSANPEFLFFLFLFFFILTLFLYCLVLFFNQIMNLWSGWGMGRTGWDFYKKYQRMSWLYDSYLHISE